jgi:hypothetical protein
MATKKKEAGVWEWLSRAGNVIKVGGVLVAAVGGLFTLAKTAAGPAILLTGIAVVSVAILGCAVVLVRRSAR